MAASFGDRCAIIQFILVVYGLLCVDGIVTLDNSLEPEVYAALAAKHRTITESELIGDTWRAENMHSCYRYFFEPDRFHNRTTLGEFTRLATQTKLCSTMYNDLLIHRYDSFTEMVQSGRPHVDEELCLRQLSDLNARADSQMRERYRSKDVNLAQLLDTYGLTPSGRLLGDAFRPGAYEECLRLTIKEADGEVPTRYCIAHERLKSWSATDRAMDYLTAVRSGVCLPRSCSSLDYKNKFQLISGLMEYNIREIDRNQSDLFELYCLPDSGSELSTWWLHPKPVLVMVCLSAWLMLLLYSTFVYGDNSTNRKFYETLSITNNLKLLFATGRKAPTERTTSAKQASVIDLRVLDGIKVISLSFVILGHVNLIMVHMTSNNRNVSDSFLVALANMTPGFVVNSFFIITGIVTSYSAFKYNSPLASAAKPSRWLAFIRQRYMRTVPMYILVAVYAKYLAKFTGSGPFWDYGTSALGHRRICEQESWWWVILFMANFKSPLKHCVTAGWYLSNDFQFLLATPLFLCLLKARPRMGKMLLRFCILAGIITCYMNTRNFELDLRPVARYEPHGYRTYITHMYDSYTRPYNRIFVYLMGLLMGHCLYLYEDDRLKLNAKRERNVNGSEQINSDKIYDWPVFLKKYGLAWAAFDMLLFVANPFIAAVIPFSKYYSRLGVPFFSTLLHFTFSLAVGIYIILAATGHGNPNFNAFLSSYLWKPLVRLNLCAVVINVEVILYLTHIVSRTMYMDFMSHFWLNTISVLVCYLVAVPLYVLFEAPLTALLNHPRSRVLHESKKDNKTC